VATHLDAGYSLALTDQGSTIESQGRKFSCVTVEPCAVMSGARAECVQSALTRVSALICGSIEMRQVPVLEPEWFKLKSYAKR
jgi:hypothetical protein